MEQTRILVVSSFVLLREGLCALLDGHPRWHAIGAAPSQEIVKQHASRMDPDIVIMDVPYADAGFEALVHSLKDTPKAPAIIVLSRRNDEESLIRILKAGVQACLCEQSSTDDLIAAIQAVATGTSFLCPAASRALLQDYRRQARRVKHDNAV